MKITRRQKWLSYLTEVHLASHYSPLNEKLVVSLKRGRLMLSAENAIYSWDDLYDNFANSFEQLKINERKVENALILGLGLGSIPYMLEHRFGICPHYTAVEADEAVIALFEEFTGPRIKASIETIHGDALIFAEICEDSFDLICMDVFLDATVPEEFESEDFLLDLKRLLNPGGLLIYNRVSGTGADKLATNFFFEHQFQQVFPMGYALQLRHNMMLIAKG